MLFTDIEKKKIPSSNHQNNYEPPDIAIQENTFEINKMQKKELQRARLDYAAQFEESW